MEITQQQGRKANNNGKVFESQILQRLISAGYQERKTRSENENQPFFIYQYRSGFISIYGQLMRVDFYVWHPLKHENGLIIECKYQEVSGSADEKFPYAIASLRGLEIPAIIIIAGKGAKTCAVDWCVRQQDEKLMVFRDFDSFLKATNKGLF